MLRFRFRFCNRGLDFVAWNLYFDFVTTLRGFLGGRLRRTMIMKVLFILIMIVMLKKRFLFIAGTSRLATKVKMVKHRTRWIPQAGHHPRRVLRVRGIASEGLFCESGRLVGPAWFLKFVLPRLLLWQSRGWMRSRLLGHTHPQFPKREHQA